MRSVLLFLLLCFGLSVHAQEKPRVQVYGTVTDSLSGRPVYTTIEHYDLAGERWALTETNSEGRYALFVPAEVPFELRVVPLPGRSELRHTLPALPASARTFRLDLRLRPAVAEAH